MRTLLRTTLTLTAAALLASPALATLPHEPNSDVAAHGERQPHMRAALEALTRAARNLRKASHDKGRHRVRALKQTELAISAVRRGISYDRQTEHSASLGSPITVHDPQPRMVAALAELTSAREALERATPDKGGHRGQALRRVRAAIDQVEAGIEHDRRTERR